MKLRLSALAFLLATSLASPAALISLGATIDSSLNGTGSSGTGIGTATIDDVTGLMTITGTFTDLNGTSTVAHLHGLTAAPNTGNASPLITLTFAGGNGTTSGSFSGSGTISSGNIQGILDGRSYINIHSSTNGGGEIRGYMNQIPEPGTAALATLSLGALLLRRRR